MTPLDSFWTGLLDFLKPIITPDWGSLITLIPIGLALLVIGFLALMARAWWRLLRAEPVRRAGGAQSLRSAIVSHVAVIVLGIVICAIAFVVGSRDPGWNGAQSPFGLMVNLPLLLAGLLVTVGAAGSGARMWDRNGQEEPVEDLVDGAFALLRRHPGRVRRLVTFFAGVLIAAAGFIVKPAANPVTGEQPVATLPILLLGLALAIAAVGSTIVAVRPRDPKADDDAPVGAER